MDKAWFVQKHLLREWLFLTHLLEALHPEGCLQTGKSKKFKTCKQE